MLFPGKKSALVRLADTLKINLDSCAATSQRILDTHRPFAAGVNEVRATADEGLKGGDADEINRRLRAAVEKIPRDTWNTLVSLQLHLHSQSLSTILTCCFTLESYINSLAYFLFEEVDFLGLVKDGHKASAEILLDAIDRMSTRDKWKTIGQIRGGEGFDRSRSPFQDFHCLFNFRDDHVHDKVVELIADRSQKRYNKKFPDPVVGQLDLRHAMYAAQTYWDMVQAIHDMVGVRVEDFHCRYNVSPWHDESHRRTLNELARVYAKEVAG